MRLWLKSQAGIWPVTPLESLHPPLLGSKRAVVNAHQEMFWGWSIFTEIKVERTDVKHAIGVAISQWLHSSMYFVSEGNNNHKNKYSRDNPKYVCSPQATEWWNSVEYNSCVICKKLGVIRWLDCPCEIIWKLHFNSLSKQFLYVLFSASCLPLPFFPHLCFFLI